jgi:hypothetical protein
MTVFNADKIAEVDTNYVTLADAVGYDIPLIGSQSLVNGIDSISTMLFILNYGTFLMLLIIIPAIVVLQ